ncbi:Mu-type opioid receptor [Acropora cervicornis]|uniref:Mu-type opioid receptor n=1 Tax=Acropora cervicornis TaxID=6130 RepID=A0AAD9QAY9_ACRCE|nr:Mu-type opioid receptor [Acropora cervicornis]
MYSSLWLKGLFDIPVEGRSPETLRKMNATFNSLSSVPTSATITASNETFESGLTPVLQAVYSTISVIAILGNTMTILVFVFDKKLLKKSYNILILALAIADVLTALQLITHPAFVLGDAFPYPTGPVLGEIFCRIIWSRVFVFQLVVFSAYIVLFLTAERWFAVLKPHKYNNVFNPKRVIAYIVFSWVWSFALTGPGLLEIKYSSSADKICEFQFYLPGSLFRVLTSIFQVIMKLIFPCLFIIALYIHMIVKTNQSTVASEESKAKLRGKMTRMIGASSLMLIICVIPNQIFLVFTQAGQAEINSVPHHIASALTFANSCINPFVYGLSNPNYRQRYRQIQLSMCPKVLRKERVHPVTVDSR